VNRITIKADSIEALPEMLESQIPGLVAPVLKTHRRSQALPPPDASSGSGAWPWVVMSSGLVGACGCGAVGSLLGVVWIGGLDERNRLDKLRADYDSNTSNPNEINNLRESYDESVDIWNNGTLQAFYVLAGGAVMGGVLSVTGLAWGLSE
jgi:hypothetical protein